MIRTRGCWRSPWSPILLKCTCAPRGAQSSPDRARPAGAALLQVLGTVKDAALVTVSVVLFHEVVSLLQVRSVLL